MNRPGAASTTRGHGRTDRSGERGGLGSVLRVAARLLGTPHVSVVLLDSQQHVFPADTNDVTWSSRPLDELLSPEPLAGRGSEGFGVAAPLMLRDDHVIGVFRAEYDSPGAWTASLDDLACLDDLTNTIIEQMRLRADNHNASQAAEQRNEMLARLSHDVRNPLTAVLGFAQLLRLEPMGEQASEGLASILNAGQEMLTLMNELVELSRLEVGELVLMPTDLQLETIVLEASGQVASIANEHGVTLAMEDSCEIMVTADHDQLVQALTQLLANAVRHSPADAKVTVSASRLGNSFARIRVRDTGEGIALVDQQRLFEPLQRLADGGRTGLGMTLARKLVEAMDGRVGVDSHPGAGATVWVDLPVPADRPSDKRSPWASVNNEDLAATMQDSPMDRSNVQCVLYLEDDPANQKLVGRLLAHRGDDIEFLSAMDGTTGLALAQERLPSLILLDLGLPGLSGLEVLQELRAADATRDIPVVVLSGEPAWERETGLLEAGATAYVGKPFRIDELLTLMNQLLDNAEG